MRFFPLPRRHDSNFPTKVVPGADAVVRRVQASMSDENFDTYCEVVAHGLPWRHVPVVVRVRLVQRPWLMADEPAWPRFTLRKYR